MVIHGLPLIRQESEASARQTVSAYCTLPFGFPPSRIWETRAASARYVQHRSPSKDLPHPKCLLRIVYHIAETSTSLESLEEMGGTRLHLDRPPARKGQMCNL